MSVHSCFYLPASAGTSSAASQDVEEYANKTTIAVGASLCSSFLSFWNWSCLEVSWGQACGVAREMATGNFGTPPSHSCFLWILPIYCINGNRHRLSPHPKLAPFRKKKIGRRRNYVMYVNWNYISTALLMSTCSMKYYFFVTRSEWGWGICCMWEFHQNTTRK